MMFLVFLCIVATTASVHGHKTHGVMTYYVKQDVEKIELLRERFHEVSNPRSEDYGNYVTFREITEIQRPKQTHIDSVLDHISSVGGTYIDRSLAGDKIVAFVPIDPILSFANDLNHSLRSYVDFISGIPSTKRKTKVRRPSLLSRRKPSSSDDPQSCLADRAVPPCIRKAYGIENEISTNENNSQAVIVNQGYKLSDLKAFCSQYNLKDCDFSITNIGKLDGDAGDEATLDVQYIQASGQGVPLTWVYINGHTSDPFANWIMWASNTSEIPLVHSLSVGEPEDEIARDNGGLSYITRMNDEMMAMSARGISIIFASGDSGTQDDFFFFNSIKHTCIYAYTTHTHTHTGYQPNQKFPSSSPYVTSVGKYYYCLLCLS